MGVLVYCLTVYGLVVAILAVMETARLVKSRRDPRRTLVLTLLLRNAANLVEDIIGTIFSWGERWNIPLHVIAVDKGSRDETVQILELLARHRECMTVTDVDRIDELHLDKTPCPLVLCDLSACTDDLINVLCLGDLLNWLASRRV
ncbi:MAG TPA: hypothetical protein GXX40_04090 [Firmicutes bacterium]|nr:hypothetical protein [Bacillota bacterium]